MSQYLTISTPLTAVEESGTSTITTTSGTNALMAGMTITPPAGTYLVWFSCAIKSSNAGSTQSVSFYVGGTQKADSVRVVGAFDGGTLSATTAICGVAINGLITVDGSQAITVEWSTTGGTATAIGRTLNTLRIA